MQTSFLQNLLLIGFGLFSIVGIVLYFIKGQRNNSYGAFAVAFLLLGIAGAITMQVSAIAAFLLSLIAARRFKTKFDKK
ncbi:MAG TPA: hypothetical protein VLA88_01620 [Candidatus Saccharimonadales bacterium]|nr:hypothetical protein [Candidatus Saccharimonadales bacterium]